MATPAEIKNRNQSAQSKVLGRLVTASGQINTTASSAVNKLLNEKFGQRNALTQRRMLRQEKIATLNKNYVARTQNVLNDKTLDFLIQHSNIDAPTLTSIFAGFELARKSAADKLREGTDVDVTRIERLDQLDVLRTNAASDRLGENVQLIENEQTRLTNQAVRASQLEGAAIRQDISNLEGIESANVLEGRQIARTAVNNASLETRSRIAAEGRRTKSQSSNLAFILGNTPAASPDVSALEDDIQDEIEDVIIEEEELPEVIAPEEDSNEQLLRDERTSLIDAIIKSPNDSASFVRLQETDNQLDLSEDERQLSFTLQALSTVGTALDQNPDDEQVVESLSFLTTAATDQAFRLSSEFAAQQDQEQQTIQLENDENNRVSEVERLTVGLSAVEAIIDNPDFDDIQTQAAIASKVTIEERLNELAKLAEA